MKAKLAKMVYDAVEPVLDGQGQVKFHIDKFDRSECIEAVWYDSMEKIISGCRISEIKDDGPFGYLLYTRWDKDSYDIRFREIIRRHGAYTNELGTFYDSWTEVEAALQAFSGMMVIEFN